MQEIRLSGLTWRSCERSKRVISSLQAGRSTRYPATIETPDYNETQETVWRKWKYAIDKICADLDVNTGTAEIFYV